jgi:hypothetical protein
VHDVSSNAPEVISLANASRIQSLFLPDSRGSLEKNNIGDTTYRFSESLQRYHRRASTDDSKFEESIPTLRGLDDDRSLNISLRPLHNMEGLDRPELAHL